MRTRIAPTPSGYLHLGNGAAFVLAWKLAQEAGGKLLLRIDDLDAGRVRPEYIEDIFRTLEWLGVEPQEGPVDAADFKVKWSQQLRLAEYHGLLNELRAGGHLYGCTCSRKDITDRTGTTVYDGHCRHLDLDLDAPGIVWRLKMPKGESVAVSTWPSGELVRHALATADPVVRQRNGSPAYQVASLADDLHFHVDTIIRGTDLLPSTMLQLHIAQQLGRTEFGEVRFLHHPLVAGPDGRKLSKSSGAVSLRHWRESGRGSQEIHTWAERLLHAGADIRLNASETGGTAWRGSPTA